MTFGSKEGKTTKVRRGEIYYVKKTETVGSEQEADRPAIIVSNDTGNRAGTIVEVVYLTTQQKNILPTHVYIGTSERPSIALCEQVFTVCNSRLERYIGRITSTEMRQIDAALTTSLGIKQRQEEHRMLLTMKTPYGDMNFDMPSESITALIQQAFLYAAVPQESKAEEKPQSTPVVPQEQPKAVKAGNKARSRVESLFGDFRGSKEVQPEKEDAEPKEYKGFLLIKCKHCGTLKGFCAKTPISEFTCECGEKTKLHDLKPAYLKCKCGGQFKYKTNETAEAFDYHCLHCGSPVDLELNNRRNTYVTIAD